MTTSVSSTNRSEVVKQRLVDALIGLLADRSIDGVSVRDVAAAAGVNHGLVHRHFGSKEGLVREAARRVGATLHAGAPAGLSARTFALLRKQPSLARVTARLCLDGPEDVLALAGPSPARLEEIVAPLRALLERLGLAGRVDAVALNALVAAALVGWFAFRPLLAAYGVRRDGDRKVAELMALIDGLVAGRGASSGTG
jgi:TetR/AcrR family transcriptional regulator, repressor for neighboring sulfatase